MALSRTVTALLLLTSPLLAQAEPTGEALATARELTAPERFLGKKVGADHFLATYQQLSGYWKKLAKESDRLVVRDIGPSSYGQRMLMAIVSSPANIARLEEYRKTSERLCRARIDDVEARNLARVGKAVVWIDAGMHATESIAAQNIIELVYRMVSRDDEEVRRILDNVILLVCPANPDGMEMVASTYMANKFVGRLPVLYQRYIGHDNNRDFYHASQPETRNINRVLYSRWYPQVVYNHHQSAPRGTIIFTPPFRDPFNYNFDPLVVRGIELVSAHMNSRFAWEQKPGVISRSGARYSTWWNGGLRTTTYFHNMIGILTESFGHPTPRPLTQPLKMQLPIGDYPDPIDGQMWHARQTIEYLQTANFAILDLAARYRSEFLFNIYQMGRNSIRRGSRDHWTRTPRLITQARARGEKARAASRPAGSTAAAANAARSAAELSVFKDKGWRDARYYMIPSDQADFAAAVRFVRSLLHTGIEIGRLREAVELGKRSYPKGSFIVSCAQAFRPHVRDMFEPQWHPDDLSSAGDPVRPYDSAGWTLAMQMGVQYDRGFDTLELPPLETVTLGNLALPPGKVEPSSAGWILGGGSSNQWRAVNRLAAGGIKVDWSPQKGVYYIGSSKATQARLSEVARELGVTFVKDPGLRTRGEKEAITPVQRRRVGLFDVYGGNMATGWTEWILKQYEFPVEMVFGKRVAQGDLRKDFDVLVFHTGLPDPGGKGRIRRALRRGRPTIIDDAQLQRIQKAMPAFGDWSQIGDRRVRLQKKQISKDLREFVEGGGVLIAMGTQSEYLARLLELPVRVGIYIKGDDGKEKRAGNSKFFIPGSLLNARLSKEVASAIGTDRDIHVMFRRSPVLEITDPKAAVSLGEYSGKEILASGWTIGAELLRGKSIGVTLKMGKGRIYLFGADIVYRGQSVQPAKLLFHAILN